MPEWLTQNAGTIVVCAVLAVVFGLLIVSLIRDRKAGKSSCCGGCKGCAMAGQCHPASDAAPREEAPSEEHSSTPPTDA